MKTNREVLIESLQYSEEDEFVADYIACPYTVGHKCNYDGGADHTPCIDCKTEWLKIEWLN